MLEALKRQVLDANLELPKLNLVTLTWGNVSGIDRASGVVIIKPSGVPYEELTIDKMVCVDLHTGEIVDGHLSPSSDTPTHIEIYKAFPDIAGVVHTHSRWATIFAQSLRAIPPFGTTHADYFFGEIPITRQLTKKEVEEAYEAATGHVIVETFSDKKPLEVPAVLVSGHGPFTWGISPRNAVHNALILEEVAMMAWHTQILNKEATLPSEIVNKHYQRKHGKDSYYGQRSQKK